MRYSQYLQSVFGEWKDFREGRPLGSEHTVRQDILDSWKRSRNALGVKEPAACPLPLRGEALERKLRDNEGLIASAMPILDQDRAMLLSSRSVLVLASADGVILYRHGAPEIMARMEHLNVGVVATEELEGTNGIGLCLVTRRPVEIFGPEHYNRRDHDWCCVSAPVWGGRHRFIGVLTVILPLEDFHSHTTGMLTAAAANISTQHRLRDVLSDRDALLDRFEDGILLLDLFGGVKAANRKARSLLNMPSDPAASVDIADMVAGGGPFTALLQARRDAPPRETSLTLGTGRLRCVLSASVTPNLRGMVFRLAEPGRAVGLEEESPAGARYTFDDIVGEAPVFRQTVAWCRAAAGNDLTVLLLGESGTGKELLAHAIHHAGPRGQRPFVVVNCGALPRELVQSELFGYEAGAFTGAARGGKAGRFELADGGTVFLDEIGEMPPDAQVSLLRFLQDGEARRVGGRFARRVDARVIAATNRDLGQAVRAGRFREDLYYRLHVLTVVVPPLRERPGDVALLARHFVRRYARRLDRPDPGAAAFSADAAAVLRAHAWPGNVRELEALVARALVWCPSAPFGARDIARLLAAPGGPAGFPGPPGAAFPALEAKASERTDEGRRAEEALAAAGGNVRAAAQALGISRSALYGRLARRGLDPARFRKH